VFKMTVDIFQAIAKPAESEVSQHLSPLEKRLCRSLSRVEVGKRDNHVPILFTADFRGAVNLLVSRRKEGPNVLESNPYLFAQLKFGSHLRGSDVMKKYASECPQALRGTALRKHVAVISQVLNLRDNELDLLAQFMGHNIRVHREFY